MLWSTPIQPKQSTGIAELVFDQWDSLPQTVRDSFWQKTATYRMMYQVHIWTSI